MERSRGTELAKVWDNISGEDKAQLLNTLVGYQKVFSGGGLPMYGSLYYANDLFHPDPRQLLNTDKLGESGQPFTVGPTTDRDFFDRGRDSVQVHRGPCRFSLMFGCVGYQLIRIRAYTRRICPSTRR